MTGVVGMKRVDLGGFKLLWPLTCGNLTVERKRLCPLLHAKSLFSFVIEHGWSGLHGNWSSLAKSSQMSRLDGGMNTEALGFLAEEQLYFHGLWSCFYIMASMRLQVIQ